ncbi:MAG: hypothetical protein IJS12_09210 [Lachnospiraceae bacterium]|nr:hypothetical protein [Lachnospiraceae bacterium]
MISNCSKFGGFFQILLVIISVCIQLHLIIPATKNISIAGDMIFTYTLANNTYSPLFFNKEVIDAIPNTNGWFNAEILREWYLVNDYDRFDYKGVYWHQRIDVHPPLYYMLIHTVCSVFPGTYSNMYAGIVNILGILIIDLLFGLLFKTLYSNYIYAALPILIIPIQGGMVSQIFNLRMYILLEAMCFWYLYIHILSDINGWSRKRLIQFILCVILGCLSHNYFYVYAFCVTLVQIIRFIIQKRFYALINYLFTGMIGIMSVLIIFPWMIWQVIFNQQGKHTEIYGWNKEKIRDLIGFINEYWFSGQGRLILFIFAICAICVLLYKKLCKEEAITNSRYAWVITACSTLIYLLIIFTLDGGRDHYNSPEYIPVLFLFSAFIIWIIKTFTNDWRITFPILLLSGIALMGNRVGVLYDYFEAIHPVDVEWNELANEYHSCDCLCIGMQELHLMDYNFYEIAQFDEVKCIDADGYNDLNLKDILSGRITGTDSVVMYIAEDLLIPDDAVLLMNHRGYNCVYMENGDE